MTERRFSEARLRVRYAETDQMGVVYYARYLVWMEVGRVQYCKDVGCDYAAMEREDGLLLAVIEAHCRYISPARFDDEIVVKTWIEEAHTRTVRFAYEIRRAADGKVLATGETKHIVLDRSLKRTHLPDKYCEAFGVVKRGAALVRQA
ncbi:MAG: acyl-CoA thioesterase [bacterium]|jgi:acyl-CoA thioester hydrolase